MRITIIGGGNIGTQFAVHCASKGHEVTILSSKPELFHKELEIVDEEGRVSKRGTISNVTSSYEIGCSDAEVIMVTVPAQIIPSVADKVLPYVRTGLKICLIPGAGGGEFAFKKAIDKGCILWGLQRVPSVARLVEYGSKVCARGYRDVLHVASIPSSYVSNAATFFTSLLDMPCLPLPNYLNVTLIPSNPILHTARMKVLFQNYKPGIFYDKIPMFYADWDEESSKLLLCLDREVQDICHALESFDLSYVKSLKQHYESDTVSKMTKKLSSIASLSKIETPMIAIGNQYIPDFSSRYFAADFPYGLAILEQIGELLQVDVSHMHQVMAWYRSLNISREEFSFSKNGILTSEDLINFYKI